MSTNTRLRAALRHTMISAVALVTAASVLVGLASNAGAVVSTRVAVGSTLSSPVSLTSPSGTFDATVTPNGAVTVTKLGHVVWSTSRAKDLLTILRRGSVVFHASSTRTKTLARQLAPSYLGEENDGDVALYSKSGVILWHAGPRTSVTASSAIYTPGEMYSSSNPSATCFTCNAAQVTGSAPPSNTLNSGTSVNAMTGDFSTGLNLFSAPAIGGGLSLSLSYDSQLAQSQLANGTSPGPFGYGWSSDFSASVTAQSGSTPTPSITVNQGNGSEVTFNQSANSGTSYACETPGQSTPSGSYPSTAKYTVSGSNHQWCAFSSVQGQLSDPNTSGITYQTQGGQSIDDFAWNGQLTEVTTNADAASPPVAGTFVLYNVAGGTTSTTSAGVPLSQQCPSGATCTIVYATDGRSLVEEVNSTGLVTTVINPSGTVYNLTYDTNNNLVSVSKPQTSSSTATWHYAYATSSPSPYQSDLVQIYDPDATFNASSPSNPGAAHSTSIAYYGTSSTPSTTGMVSSLEDGTGAVTSYSYADPCANGQCVAAGSSQSTTILYPPETPCPGATGCTAQSPVEVDQYSNGLEISTQLGSTAANGAGDETWSYNWNYGNGTANSVELITYPNTQNSSIAAPTATIVTDPAGNIVSTTNALGDVATSYYNDTGGNDLNELLWSYPGPVANPSATAPAGSSTYSYNVYGQVVTETDPVGNATSFGYYQSDSLLCFTAPPSVQLSSGIPTCSSSLTTSDVGAVGAPSGATTYSYDAQGDVIATTLDNNDAAGDPQTTTASYDALGNQLWSIPATGQTLGQSAANPFATSTTYSLASQPLVTHAPDGQVTTNTYDTVGNLTSSTNNAATTTTVYDADNRACYSMVASGAVTGLTCTSSAQAGSSATTYVPGSLALATRTDANNNKTSYYYADLAYPSSPTEVVDPMASEVSYTAYDDWGNACLSGDVAPTFGVAQCTWTAQDTGHTYNALGAVTTITDPNGLVTTNYYDDASFPTNLTRTMNSLGKVTSYTYDGDGRLLTTTNPSGSAESVNYTANGQTCQKEPTATVYPCYEGPAIAGVSEFTYNNAGELTSMNDNVGAPNAATWSQATQYSYANGQLLSTTNPSGASVSYAYNNAGQVSCIGYPVSTSTSCAAPASATNTIVSKSYDNAGRLTSLTDWLGNTTTYSYGDANDPGAPTTIAYPSSTGLNLSYGYDPAGNLTSLTAGTLHDTWTYNADEQQLVASLNGTTSSPAAYNANGQVTAATNLATSTSNDTFTLAANGQINADQAPSGATTSFSYVASSGELCNVATSSTPCGATPQNGTTYTYNADGQRASATTSTAGIAGATTTYSYNALGELCSVGSNANCGATPSSGVTYNYNGLGLRVNATTATSSTTSTWDTVSSSLPENLNDATTSAGATTNISYLYGDVLFGSSAPSEQITTNTTGAAAEFLIIIPEGVQEVVSASGSVLEQASYSTYGVQTITAGSLVTPYGFQGAYRDATGLLYLINRYYDPSTNEFVSIDPDVQQTDQPYLFVNGDPLNSTDPLGLCWGWCTFTDVGHAVSNVGHAVIHVADVVRHGVAAAADATGRVVDQYKVAIILTVATLILLAATGGAASVMLTEIATEAADMTAAEVAESVASEDIVGDSIMEMAKLDPMRFVAMGSAVAAPAALAGISGYATVKTAVSESTPKKKK